MRGTICLSIGPWAGMHVFKEPGRLQFAVGWLTLSVFCGDSIEDLMGSYSRYVEFLRGQWRVADATCVAVSSRLAQSVLALRHALRFDWSSEHVPDAEATYLRRLAALSAGLPPGSEPDVAFLCGDPWVEDPMDIVRPVHPLDYPEEDFGR